MRYLGLAWYVQRFLERLGMSDYQAMLKTKKIRDFEDWLLRHPITILMITLSTDAMDDKWHQCTASFDNVKFQEESGIWRKTIVFMVKAKMESKIE